MVVNDNAGCLTPRVILKFFVSKLAPTGKAGAHQHLPGAASGGCPVFLSEKDRRLCEGQYQE
ncbi:hypothetical protein DOZ80_04575 [Pseudomonas fluorescens]|uniref:Uncharacterized protein n=1 Tax=Pseudomonas fluorescens TaxID=294 RepID=A0A327NA66_PSEFL|nr:hypothetical protein DOZ80_04575 [Pseudomonas fluorescens]